MRLTQILLFIFMAGCKADPRQLETYKNIVPGVAPTLSNIEQHRGGFQRNECLLCHNVNLNVHRTADAQINVDALNSLIRSNQGSKYCTTCHGTNGVSQ